jgi:hypothetical protein
MYTNAEIDSSRFQCCGINFVLREVHFNFKDASENPDASLLAKLLLLASPIYE